MLVPMLLIGEVVRVYTLAKLTPLVILFFLWWSSVQTQWLHELHNKWDRSAENLCYSRKCHSCTVLRKVCGVSKRDFNMFHQNIRGLVINKIDDIAVYLNTSPIQVLCISEHHLDMNEIETLWLPNYNLTAKFCRNTFKRGGVCIFTHETIWCSSINLNKFCREKNLEICAIELHLQFSKLCIMTIVWRFPIFH